MLSILLLGTPAWAFESEPQHVSFKEGGIPLFEGQQWASDWVGSGSLQVQVVISPDLKARVETGGEANVSWPSALEFDVAGDANGGLFEVTGDFLVTTRVKVDAFGYEVETDVDTQSFPVEAGTMFDPFLLQGSSQTSVDLTIAQTEDLSYEYAITDEISVIGTVALDMDALVTLSDGYFEIEGEPLEREGDLVPVVTTGGQNEKVRSTWSAQLLGDSSFSYGAVVDVCFLSFGCISIEPYTNVNEIGVDAFRHAFPEHEAIFPLPQLELDEDVLDLGEVTVGETTNHAFSVANDGDLDLEVIPTLQGNGDLELLTPILLVTPSQADMVNVSVTPSAEGPIEATLTLATNDPMIPTVDVVVMAMAVLPEIPEDNDPVDTGDLDNDGNGDVETDAYQATGGCGCASTKAVSPLWLALGATLLVVRRRR